MYSSFYTGLWIFELFAYLLILISKLTWENLYLSSKHFLFFLALFWALRLLLKWSMKWTLQCLVTLSQVQKQNLRCRPDLVWTKSEMYRNLITNCFSWLLSFLCFNDPIVDKTLVLQKLFHRVYFSKYLLNIFKCIIYYYYIFKYYALKLNNTSSNQIMGRIEIANLKFSLKPNIINFFISTLDAVHWERNEHSFYF